MLSLIHILTDFSNKISQLENEKATLQNQLSTDVNQLISPAYGYFGSYCDTASGIVTTALLSDTTVSQLEDLAGTRYEQNRSYSGQVILGYTWYYAALVHAEDAKRFSVGTTASLYFGSSTSEAVPCLLYTSQELKELEDKIMTAGEKILRLEAALFDETRKYVADQLVRTQRTSNAIARLDVFCSLAGVAVSNRYVRPVVDLSDEIKIQDGRHPVVEEILNDVPFVANDT